MEIEWVLKSYDLLNGNDKSIKQFARDFLQIKDVYIRTVRENPALDIVDMMILGPANRFPAIMAQTEANMEVRGPAFEFTEIGHYKKVVEDVRINKKEQITEIYQKLHSLIFPFNREDDQGLHLLMGIRPGCGVFKDPERCNAPLSNIHSCPSYLSKLKDLGLKKDVFSSFQSEIFTAEENSFNFGYSHLISARRCFLDCLALSELSKHVIVVINQTNKGRDCSDDEFIEKIFSEKRLNFLDSLGFSDVMIKTHSGEYVIRRECEPSRKFVVISRHTFLHEDFKNLQLASERTLATGDNSAIEALCAKCKTYFYEMSYHKMSFLDHQEKLAAGFSTKLANFIRKFAGSHDDYILDHSDEFREMLLDPELEMSTLALCEHMQENFSFEPILEASLKRTAWMYADAQLEKIEIDSLPCDFKEFIVKSLLLKNREKQFTFKDLRVLEQNVRSYVESHASEGTVFTRILKMFSI